MGDRDAVSLPRHPLRHLGRLMTAGLPTRNLGTRFRRIRGDVFLASDREVYQLSEVGAAVWRHMDGDRPEEEIAGLVAREFDADPAQVSADVETFVNFLVEMGLAERKCPG